MSKPVAEPALGPPPGAPDPELAAPEPRAFVPATPFNPTATKHSVDAKAAAALVNSLAATSAAPPGAPMPTAPPPLVPPAAPTPPAPPAPPTELNEEEIYDFSMLLNIGRRTKTLNVFDHKVVVQSLNVDDDLRIGLFCKEYQGAPPAEQRSYQIACCAAAIVSIDGAPIYTALSPEVTEEEIFLRKTETLRKFYPVVLSEIYKEVLLLDKQFYELAVKLGKLSG